MENLLFSQIKPGKIFGGLYKYVKSFTINLLVIRKNVAVYSTCIGYLDPVKNHSEIVWQSYKNRASIILKSLKNLVLKPRWFQIFGGYSENSVVLITN